MLRATELLKPFRNLREMATIGFCSEDILVPQTNSNKTRSGGSTLHTSSSVLCIWSPMKLQSTHLVEVIHNYSIHDVVLWASELQVKLQNAKLPISLPGIVSLLLPSVIQCAW